MKHDPIFLEPIFKERIWGGTKLRDRFQYRIPSCQTGECWGISAHPNGLNTVKGGPFSGMRLDRLWTYYPELFGNRRDDTFPLLVKIIDANRDLPVQVHPGDVYARKHENDKRGKTACWYVIDCEEGAELIYGHHAASREELKRMIDAAEWGKLLRKEAVQPGDFLFVPSGTLHGLPAGTLILEIQQNSDTTYRVYDYNRTDGQGRPRKLHLSEALDVIRVPHEHPQTESKIRQIGGTTITTFVEGEFFTVSKWDLNGTSTLEQDQDFLLVSILEGEGCIRTNGQRFSFQKGDHFILPSGIGPFDVGGRAMGITSHP